MVMGIATKSDYDAVKSLGVDAVLVDSPAAAKAWRCCEVQQLREHSPRRDPPPFFQSHLMPYGAAEPRTMRRERSLWLSGVSMG
jgi:hypothetical protein